MRLYDIELYRLLFIVDEAYNDNRVNTIDFTRHLQPLIALEKKTIKDNEGRPVTASYYNDGELIAVIRFTFTNNETNDFLLRRQETLYYTLIDGSDGAPIVLSDKTYDLTDQGDLEISMLEKEMSREAILARMKGYIFGVIQNDNPSLSSLEIACKVKGFWDKSFCDRGSFVAIGDDSFRDYVLSIYMPLTWSWLRLTVGGKTLQTYIVETISL